MLHYFLLYITAIVGSCSTFWLSTRAQQGPVRASALVTLPVALLLYFYPDIIEGFLARNIPVVLIGSTFVGMVSAQKLNTYIGLIIAALLYCTIFIHTSKFFTGYGGALGTSACISIVVTLCVPYFSSKRKLTLGLLQLRRLALKGYKKVEKNK
jgi:hypothetical protein